MPDATTRHAAALILRWSAQLAAGEDAVTLSGGRGMAARGDRDAGREGQPPDGVLVDQSDMY